MSKKGVETEARQALGRRDVADIAPGSVRVITDSSSIVFKDYESITIPQQLKNIPNARYIRLETTDEKRKKPIDYKWTTETNYQENHAVIKGWLKGGNDYGIATGFGNLHCFDCDNLERLTELGVLEKLPRTFTVATGKGQHHWLLIPGLKKKITMYNDEQHLGEIQSLGQYAVGPGSMHKSGKRYQVIDESQVATITEQALLEILTNCNITTTKKQEKIHEINLSEITRQNQHDDVDLASICKPLHGIREGSEIVGEHPLHGALHTEDRGTSRNFSINASRGVWCCRAHSDSGGGWREWIALELGILRCEECGSRKLDRNEYRLIYEEAERRGLITRNQPLNQPSTKPSRKITLDKIPDRLPIEKLLGIIGSPREGKTYKAMEWLKIAKEGNYITQNHAIIAHAIEMAKKIGLNNIVHVEGKHQPGMCRKPDNEKQQCSNCIMFPNQHREPGDIGETHIGLLSKARQLLREKNILTKNEIPSDMCPYFTLIRAGYEAQYVFTVVNNIEALFANTVRNRKLTIIDEDTTLGHFYPRSIEIASITTKNKKIHISTDLDKTDITNEITKTLSSDGKRNLKIYANKINDIKNTIDDLEGTICKMQDVANAIKLTLINWIPTQCKLEDEGYGDEENIKFGDIVKTLMNLYMDMPVRLIQHGSSAKIFLLADERLAIMNMKWFERAEHVVLIGAAITELFCEQFNGKIIEIPEFKFKDNFVVLAVELDKEDDQKGKTLKMKNKLVDIIKQTHKTNSINTWCPLMYLTGSKDEQTSIANKIGGKTFKTTTEREHDLKRMHVSGTIMGMYQNSTISRGQDVDQYNVMVAIGTDFANPFWSAIDQEMANKITIDETTNSVLRISPTTGDGTKRTKVILISDDHAWKIKYLKSRIIKTDASAKGIARTLKKLNIPGETTYDEANNKITITKPGTNDANMYERLFTSLQNADLVIEDDIKENAVALILRMLKENWRKTWCKKEIKEMTKLPEHVARPVLAELSYEKKITTIQSRRSTKYQHKKPAMAEKNQQQDPEMQEDISITDFLRPPERDST